MGWGGTGAYQYHSDVPKVRWDTDRDLTSESLYVHMMASARAPDGCVAFTNHLPSLVSSLRSQWAGSHETRVGWLSPACHTLWCFCSGEKGLTGAGS